MRKIFIWPLALDIIATCSVFMAPLGARAAHAMHLVRPRSQAYRPPQPAWLQACDMSMLTESISSGAKPLI